MNYLNKQINSILESNFKLVTSNQNKLNEFKRFGIRDISIESGRDLQEVEGTDIEVILYKALEAGKNRIVEDTSLKVDGYEIGVNIRWLLNDLKKINNASATWKVLLGLNDGINIKVYEGVINGKLKSINNVPTDGFGFDPYFFPSDSDKSLYELEKLGIKDNFSARQLAVNNLIKNKSILIKKIKDIPEWTGKYQH